MKWGKLAAFSWRLYSVPDGRVASIDKVNGNGFPYVWAVRAFPPPIVGPWRTIADGSCRKLAEAKAEAEAAIQRKEGAR